MPRGPHLARGCARYWLALYMGGRAWELRPRAGADVVVDDEQSGWFMKAFGRLHIVFFLPFIIILFLVWVLTGAFAFSTIYIPLSLVMAIFWQVVQSSLYCILEFARRRTSNHKLSKLRKMQDLVDRAGYALSLTALDPFHLMMLTRPVPHDAHASCPSSCDQLLG